MTNGPCGPGTVTLPSDMNGAKRHQVRRKMSVLALCVAPVPFPSGWSARVRNGWVASRVPPLGSSPLPASRAASCPSPLLLTVSTRPRHAGNAGTQTVRPAQQRHPDPIQRTS